MLNFLMHLAFTNRRVGLTIHPPLAGLLRSYRYQQERAFRKGPIHEQIETNTLSEIEG